MHLSANYTGRTIALCTPNVMSKAFTVVMPVHALFNPYTVGHRTKPSAALPVCACRHRARLNRAIAATLMNGKAEVCSKLCSSSDAPFFPVALLW
jgi:hypothetical protein